MNNTGWVSRSASGLKYVVSLPLKPDSRQPLMPAGGKEPLSSAIPSHNPLTTFSVLLPLTYPTWTPVHCLLTIVTGVWALDLPSKLLPFIIAHLPLGTLQREEGLTRGEGQGRDQGRGHQVHSCCFAS